MATANALEFLQRAYPQGPWCLTAIAVDKKEIWTQTFYPDSLEDMRSWIEGYNGCSNLYFHVNPVRYAVTKKAERTDIESVNYLHVDLDAEPGVDLNAERTRLLLSVTRERPESVPEPSIIVSSGGGIQAFWRLDTPIPIKGELSLAEDAKRYNQQLELIFSADNCHNIDRIMRLPGTENIPDAKKLKKGRERFTARVLQFKDLEYSLGSFKQLPIIVVTDKDSSLGGGSTIYDSCRVSIGGNIRRLADIDELNEWQVPDRIKVICVQGSHPDQPKEGDQSRSAWLFDAVCNLVRCSVPDDVIYSIITDPDFGISESVLEWKGRAHSYAVRQIEQAKEQAIDPFLVELNKRYVVIANYGGKCRIVERIDEPVLGRSRVTKLSFEDFRNSWMNRPVQVGLDAKGAPKFMPAGHWWLQHPQRRQSRTITFAPSVVLDPKMAYNLWQGFAFDPKPGDCSMLLDHIEHNICSGSVLYTGYLLDWMARAVQQPASSGETAIVLKGSMGTGKTFLAKVFGALWGPHYMMVSNSAHLVGNFNAHLRDVCFLFADEAFFAGDMRNKSVLKSLITDDQMTVEPKGVDAEMSHNYLHIMMASNEHWVVPAGEDERRYLILQVSDRKHQNSEYFGAISRELQAKDKDGKVTNAGYAAFLHFLLARDISTFNVRNVPQTAALQGQKHLSMGREEEWWFRKLQYGLVLEEHDEWVQDIPKQVLVDDFINDQKRWNTSHRGTETRLGMLLATFVPELSIKRILTSVREHVGNGMFVDGPQRRLYHWCLPTLAECRRYWDLKHGKTDWLALETIEQQARLTELPF